MRDEPAQRRRADGDMLAHHHQRIIALVGQSASQTFVQKHAQRINVGALIAAIAFDLLGRHVIGRANLRRHLAPGDAARALHKRDAEIHHLRAAIGRDNDILRLQVAVEDMLRVRVCQRLRDLHAKRYGTLDRQTVVLPHHLAQRDAIDVFQHQIRVEVTARQLVQLLDTRVRQQLADLDLAPETFVGRWVAGHVGVRELEHDFAPVLIILGKVDFAHAAVAELVHNRILVDHFTWLQGHTALLLRLRKRVPDQVECAPKEAILARRQL